MSFTITSLKSVKLKATLLFVDLQNDYLNRSGITPARDGVTNNCAQMLQTARLEGLGIIHAQTLVSAKGHDAMPHWKKNDNMACQEGSTGALAPPELTPLENETIITKRYYSAFESGALDTHLKAQKIDLLIISGLYTHACIRSTALDAYSHGYNVLIVSDAIGSTEPLHAEITREFLEKREFLFSETNDVLKIIGTIKTFTSIDDIKTYISHSCKTFFQVNPSHIKTDLIQFDTLSDDTIETLLLKAKDASIAWERKSIHERADVLLRWHKKLNEERAHWIEKIVEEVGKPIKDATEEFERALQTIYTVIEVGLNDIDSKNNFRVIHRAVGTVLCITPWNNPMAIPIGKMAPALMYGNAVVWKPSLLSTRLSFMLLASMIDSGLDEGLVVIIPGGTETARRLIRHPVVSRVSLTGSVETGNAVSALCSVYKKTLQAELGGNNAVIVFPNTQLEKTIPELVKSAFSYSGQRCTANRRFIVDSAIVNEFCDLFVRETAKLIIGHPHQEQTNIGPLISKEHYQSVLNAIQRAEEQGAEVLSAVKSVSSEDGYWVTPTVIKAQHANLEIVQKETFGPVAVIITSDNLEDAIQKNNAVSYGLVSSIIGCTTEQIDVIQHRLEAGILKIGLNTGGMDMSAPFFGWKDSSIGVPEHGRWDKEFYSRVQVVYGDV
jgi:acyl-CoA reductase-like NAD-dependent aldehyde dehydrogenase/nicotinamidase-related amidase